MLTCSVSIFYGASGGLIDCELEVDRWSKGHWTGMRESKVELLHSILEKHGDDFSQDIKEALKGMFNEKHFYLQCTRKSAISDLG